MTKVRKTASLGGFSPFARRRLPIWPRLSLGLLAAGTLLAALPVQGETILRYSMAGQPGSQETTPPSTLVTGLNATDIVRGSGIAPTGLVRGMSSNDWSTVAEGTDGRQQAIDANEYYEFSFSVSPGYVASLSALDHSLRRSAFNGPMFYEWQYSFDGFATPGITITPQGAIWMQLGWTEDYFTYRGRNSGTGGVAENYNYMIEDVSDQNEGNPMPTFDLTGVAALQDMPSETTVTFRLYAWGNANTAPTNTVALGRENDTQIGGPMISGSVIVDPALGDQFPLEVRSDHPGTDPEPGGHYYSPGTEITATAPELVADGAGVRYRSTGWTGEGSVSAGEGSSVTFTLNEPSILEWLWATEHRLLVETEGSGSVQVRRTEPYLLLGYEFSSYTTAESTASGVPASTVADAVEPSTITRGAGINPANLGAGGISSNNWHLNPSFDTALSGDKYLEFNVTPAAGQSLELSSIYMPYRYTRTGPHSIALVYSLDDFSTFAMVESMRIQDQASGTQTATHTFILSDDPQLQNVTSEVKFRVYGWGGTGSGVGTFAIYNEKGAGVDDMVIFGGESAEATVTGSEAFWLSPQAFIQVEAQPDAGSIFTGWSGSFFSNRHEMAGLDMRQPLVFTASFAADSDGDGIPDDWELQHFGDLSAAAEGDPDDDGFTNLEEYIRGSDPASPENILAAGDVPLSPWENPHRDPAVPGAFTIRDFGSGYRGAWEGSNHNRSALAPFHPEGEDVPVVDNASFDGPQMVVRADEWLDEWKDGTFETVISVGDNDGNTFFFRYQDPLNFYRVSIAGQDSNAPTRPLIGVSVQKRVNGVYSELIPAGGIATDPTDIDYYKRLRVRVTANGSNFTVEVAGWEVAMNRFAGPGEFGFHSVDFTDTDLESGRAGFGTWAQGGFASSAEWNPVDAGTLFETFRVVHNDQVVFDEDWTSAPEAADFPAGWENPFAEVAGLAGDWRVSAHGTIAQVTAEGTPTSSSTAGFSADGEGPLLLAPSVEASNYVLDMDFHPFGHGAVGFVFDYIDEDNYGRVLFANALPGGTSGIPSGVVVSRKQAGVWSDLFIGDTAFIYQPGQPFEVSFNRSGNEYSMAVQEIDRPDNLQRWQWSDASAPNASGRHGFTTWQSAHAHFLSIEVYGAAASTVEGIGITAIEKVGENIVLTVENPSGEPYRVERTLDLTDGQWETVDTGQTTDSWSGPIPAGADRAFWRLAR